jgi:outer membrane protein assembly factor BamD (BamD/ComL family)|tara:strand:+ start:81 stop:317 length:237 start_codon:yes stop_codon:yes gene_type:complete
MDEEHQREYGQYLHENKENKELDLRKIRMVSEAAESSWKMIQDSNNMEDLRHFLEQFPDSPYSMPAKLKLKQLERKNQ